MKKISIILVSLCFAFTAQIGMASSVAGSINIAGFANGAIAPKSVDFLCSAGAIATQLAPCAAGPVGAGNFITTSGTLSFAPYNQQGGYIQDLFFNVTTPLNVPFLLLNFVTFSSTPLNPVVPPDIAFDLSFIFLGVSGQAQCFAPPAPGQACTPIVPALVTPANPLGLAPYNMQNLAGGTSTVSIALAGEVRQISTGELSPFTGTLTWQFSEPYQDLLAALATGGAVSSSYSATFSATAVPTPEPGSLVLLTFGLMTLAGMLRKKL